MEDNKLYFIPIIKKAFDDPEPIEAFRLALQEIIKLGSSSQYEAGYEQFEEFLGSGIGELIKNDKHFSDFQLVVMERLMFQLATDNFVGSSDIKEILLDKIKANPILNDRYEKLLSELPEYSEDLPLLEVELFRANDLVVSQNFPKKTGREYFKNITPGQYILKLSNGRILWEGIISAKDVIWKKAFPDRDYAMQAETVKQPTEPTRSLQIFNGQIKLTFEAGLEAGKIKLELLDDKE